MNAMLTIAKREILSFFMSPLAYVVLTGWLVWQGGVFFAFCFYLAGATPGTGSESDPLRMLFGNTTLFFVPLLVFVPVLTMRLLAEETRQGTLETLLTAPVTSVSVVLGKYIAALVFWCGLWVPTLMYVWLTSRFGDVDWGRLGATYLGIFGVGAYYMSIGLLMSSIAKSQIVAAVLTFMSLGGLFVLGIFQFFALDDATLEIVRYVSVWQHMQGFSAGIVDTRYLAYDFTLAAVGVLLAIQVLEIRRTEA